MGARRAVRGRRIRPAPYGAPERRAGRAIVAGAAVTLYRVGTIKRLAGLRCYVAVDGGMSDNPRPVLYGSGYEAFLPRRHWRRGPSPRGS